MSYYMSEKHKACIKKWNQNNPERLREISREYYHRKKLENPREFYAKKIWKERRRVSLKNGVPFEISLEYLLSLPSNTCPVFGVTLEWGTGSDHTASLDKIKPSLGYVEGNIVWMSFRANSLKRDATVEEVRQLLSWYENV